MKDTIAAIATPASVGGIGIVRLSGPMAKEIASRVFAPKGRRTVANVAGYSGIFGRVLDGRGEFDEAIAWVYTAPKSYTGEDVVELSCHGGYYLVQRLLRACLEAGARLAEAGEFTKRAFLNGKMTLTQAEAVMDLISAQGFQASQAALAAKDGETFRRVRAIAEKLIHLAADLAAWADYPDEDLPQVEEGTVEKKLQEILRDMDQLLSSYDAGRLVRDGVDTVIVGRPNVGKSTLMNLLSGVEKSIVTDIPGTTRDVVEDRIMLGDVLLNLADTAGLRESQDPVEQRGVAIAKQRMDRSVLVLAVFDRSQPLTKEDRQLLEELRGRPAIGVVNKSDLPAQLELEELRQALEQVVEISAAQGQGAQLLAEAVKALLPKTGAGELSATYINERQRDCLRKARQAAEEGQGALLAGCTLDAVNVCVDQAVDCLLELTGEKARDAVVEDVFARFCVGK